MKKFKIVICAFTILQAAVAQEGSLSLSEALRVAVSKNYGVLIAKMMLLWRRTTTTDQRRSLSGIKIQRKPFHLQQQSGTKVGERY